jgi:hypothetical protein
MQYGLLTETKLMCSYGISKYWTGDSYTLNIRAMRTKLGYIHLLDDYLVETYNRFAFNA